MANDKQVEHEKSEVVVLTTEKLLQDVKPIVDEIVDLPDGRKGEVKVRRGNVAEVFASLGTYSLTRAPQETEQAGDAQSQPEENSLQTGILVMHELIIAFMEEPKFKFDGTEGDAVPVEWLTQDELNAYYNVVNKVNNPEEVDRFFASFRGTDADGTGQESDDLVGQESGKIPPPTE